MFADHIFKGTEGPIISIDSRMLTPKTYWKYLRKTANPIFPHLPGEGC